MAHTYTSNSVTKLGDQVTVQGTVDGAPVTVQFWASAVAGMTPTQQVEFVAGLMLAALPTPPEDLTSQFPVSYSL